MIAPITPAGPAAPAAPGGPAGPCGPDRACGELAWREVRAEKRARGDLRRVDRVVLDLRIRHRAVLQLRRPDAVPRNLRRCGHAGPAERDEQRQTCDDHRRRRPAQELSHVVPLSPWPACDARLPRTSAEPLPGAAVRLRFPYSRPGSDSKYSPDRRPVRRLTWRSSRSTSRRPLRSRIVRIEVAAIVDDDDHRGIGRERLAVAAQSRPTIPSTYSSTARLLVPRAAAPSSRSRRSSSPRSSYA